MQLAIKVRLIEHLKAEKTKPNKYHKKGKVAYAETDEEESWEETEVNVVKLHLGPPYACKLLKPSNGKKKLSRLRRKEKPSPKLTRLI